jgi:N-acetylglutamate synthase-like GNAT family acetyltransferase
MSADIEIRPAQASDLTVATEWLSSEGLPTDDLTADHMDSFIVATQAGEPVGMIGIERFVEVGLLRSLIVDTACRGAGLGARLVMALELSARNEHIDELWLLTIDANPFFARHGYVVVERDAAPKAIRNTAEFSALCPGDAVLMFKHL